MKNSTSLIKPDRGYRYHLIVDDINHSDYQSDKPVILKCFACPDVDGKFESDELLSLAHVFISGFTAGSYAIDLTRAINSLSLLYKTSSSKTFKDFIDFTGIYRNAVLIIAPNTPFLSSVKCGAHILCRGNEVYSENGMKYYFVEAIPSKITLFETTPYDLLLDLFAGREKIPAETMPHLGFKNPFAQILQGRIDADTFMHAQRCLKDPEFKTTFLKSIYPEPSDDIMEILVSRRNRFSLNESEKEIIRTFMDGMNGNKKYKTGFLYCYCPELGLDELGFILSSDKSVVCKARKKINK